MAIKFLKGDRGWYCTFLDFAILSLGIGWVIFLLHLSSPKHARFTYLDVERDAGDMLHYGHNTDLTQDVIGFRAICRNQDAYPLLGPAMDKLGVVARVEHRSTHPPTAFLLVGPVAWLPINPGFVMDHTVPQQSGRPDNASIVGQAHRHFGRTGLLAATIFLLLVFASNCREILRGSLIGWTALSYLAVAALPILWIYSVVPLLFMGRWAWLGGWLAKLIFLTFFIATTLDLTQDSPELLATSVAWLGIGLIATEWMKSGLSLTP
jgi:hypothetical protein